MNICLIANTLKPDYCIETGTYLGTSTIFLAGLARKTWTIEINEAFLQKAKNRFKYSCANLNIEAITGNSVLELPKILKSFSSNEKVLVYLDAHWLHNVPTGNEISILNEWGDLWVAVIDDFKVDHDPGYGYDSYGNLEVSLNIIPNIEY